MDERVDRADAGGDDDDQQREDDAHAEDGDDDAPGQEPVLPDRRHVLELVGIHDGIVEGERNLQHRENGADEEDGRHAGKRSGRLPAQPCAERKADDGRDECPFEIGEGGLAFAVADHDSASMLEVWKVELRIPRRACG